MRRKFCV